MRKTRTRTGVVVATVLSGVLVAPVFAAGPAVATYEGNDGRLYFGAFDPANGRSADLYSTRASGDDLRQLTESGSRRDICPAISADGTRVALCSDRTGSYEIWTMKANGKALAQLTSLGGYSVFPDWSPGGDRIAFTHGTPDNPDVTGIWVADSATGAAQRLVPAATAPGLWADAYPAWSPDGTSVLFVRQRLNEDGPPFPIEGQLWLYELGTGTATQLTTDSTVKDQVPDWSPDGSRIAYGADDDVWVINADGSGPANLTHSDAAEFGAAWSPRGGWIAFTGAGADVPAGQRYVQVMRADGADRRVVAPTPGLLQAVAGWQPLGGGR
jgi:Tol biopolymer transport system component